ncbi:type III secretion protein W [Paramixta manurensis]|uniref:Type III secretion protein W n=1 Tax=Paramixta manurensis TaxID=2740817 RepID=A0A6M8ULQ5_9GAMM|nr:type III secretion protein W [Erwiniaceae bacterium PD-1]
MNMKIPQHHLHKLPQELKQQEDLLDELSPDEKSQTNAPRIRSPQARVTDALEELGTLFAEKNEMQSKRDEQRALSRGSSRSRIALTKIERLTELYQLLESRNAPAQQKREDAIDELLVGEKAPSSDQLVDAADGDPTLADTLLRVALSKAQRLGQSDKIAAATAALSALAEKFGAQISAGLNTAPAIAAFTTHPEHKMTMRQLYYSVVIEQQSAETIFDTLLEKFGGEGFEPALRTLQRALSDDIAALASSASRTALRKILSGLDDTRAITNTLSKVDDFLASLKTKYPQVTVGNDVFTRTLLSMCHKGFQAHEVTRLGAEVVGQQPLHQSLFYNQFLTLVLSLPNKLWGNDESNRSKAITMLRTLNGEYANWEKRFAHSQS